jgi:alcohol dehydrogenase (NADP+)
MNNVHLGGSAIGSPKVIKEMLELAAKQNVQPWIIKRKLDDVNQTIVDMSNSKARYVFRFGERR